MDRGRPPPLWSALVLPSRSRLKTMGGCSPFDDSANWLGNGGPFANYMLSHRIGVPGYLRWV
jgi:hypothetical protein